MRFLSSLNYINLSHQVEHSEHGRADDRVLQQGDTPFFWFALRQGARCVPRRKEEGKPTLTVPKRGEDTCWLTESWCKFDKQSQGIAATWKKCPGIEPRTPSARPAIKTEPCSSWIERSITQPTRSRIPRLLAQFCPRFIERVTIYIIVSTSRAQLALEHSVKRVY